MIVIESVPTWSCENCGEVYITAEVSRAIDEVVAHPDLHTKKRPVKIASLAGRVRRLALLPPPPLRSVRATFTAHGSSLC